MRLVIVVFLLGSLVLVAQDSPASTDSRRWLNQGVREYKAARYSDATEAFQMAVDLNPNDVTARLYLATVWMTQYIPGAGSPENLDFARKAENEFNRVLGMEPNNVVALESLASLTYQQAQGMQDLDQKSRKLDEAAARYERLLAVDPGSKGAYYSIGVIDWVKWYANYSRARADMGMRPEEPGPFRDAAVRQRLRQQYSAVIEHGISNLGKALAVDPAYDDAMAYMNLFIRERADLLDSAEKYRSEIALADEWVKKALDAKKSKAEAAQGSQVITWTPPPPPPPPPPPSQSSVPSNTPERIRVGGNVQRLNLIHKVDPVYPQMALKARIQGTVRFTAIVGHDGRVMNLQLVSGHPLLIESAREAVIQWVYKPTLLNGELVEVVTQIDVEFSLGLKVPQ